MDAETQRHGGDREVVETRSAERYRLGWSTFSALRVSSMLCVSSASLCLRVIHFPDNTG